MIGGVFREFDESTALVARPVIEAEAWTTV
jgi:hypothetical protein